MCASPLRRATLHDVARHAGVSHMTVARVVRGKNNVAPGTREKVRRALADLNYRSDPVLSALAAYRTRAGGRGRGSVLAFLDCDGDAYSRLVCEGARTEATQLGYALQSFPVPSAPAARRRLGGILFHRGIRGLLFGPSDLPQSFSGWNWSGFVTVSLGALIHQPAMNAVTIDYFESAVRAFDLLWSAGCRRIGFVVSPLLENRTGHRWVGGYAARAGSQTIIYSRPAIFSRDLRRWATEQRIDGLLTIHREVWRVLGSRKIPMIFLNEFECPPGLPHFVYDARRIGQEGIRLIHHQLLNHEFDLPVLTKTLSLQASLAGSQFNR